jgi:D-alanine-D-alanine ligase
VKVVILFDDVDSRPTATPDEMGVLEAVTAVEDALDSCGHESVRVPAGTNLARWSTLLREAGADLVFNLCEGLGGRSEGEVLAARVVEGMGLPMTGSPPSVLALARRKDRVNSLLVERGLPVPPWGLWNGFSRDSWASEWDVFPAIVKPAAEDGSVGITQDSVVSDRESLAHRMWEIGEFSPLLVQAFVGSREINAGIVGDQVLPLSEIVFSDLPARYHPIVGYEAKWSPGSPEDRGTRPVCPASLPPSLTGQIGSLAMQAWRAVGGAGYGRVDFRLTEPDILHVLEVNPNPDLAPSAGLARMASAQGWSYSTLVDQLLSEALSVAAAGVRGGQL